MTTEHTADDALRAALLTIRDSDFINHGPASTVAQMRALARAALAQQRSEPAGLDVPFTAIGELLAHSIIEVEEGRYECRLCDADVSARKSSHEPDCEWAVVKQWVARLSEPQP